MPYAELGPIVVHLPERVETNAELAEQYPRWDLPLIEEKTGIRQRHIAAPEETSADLAVAAAEKLFAQHGINRDEIEALYKDGVLKLTLPKAEVAKPRKISVRTA